MMFDPHAVARALGDARREGRTWRLLCRLRRTSAIKNYLA
jgi:hypothetical protein